MTTPEPTRPPLPPFTRDTAIEKIRKAEDAWNARDPEKVALAYTQDSCWRNRSEFITGRAAIVDFLRGKWAREHEYRLIKELWAFRDDRIAVRFAYEWHDDERRLVPRLRQRELAVRRERPDAAPHASINDVPIRDEDRKFFWDRDHPRPADHPGLTDLGL